MTILPEGFALPALNSVNEPWFTLGTLAIQQCASCATLQHPPEEICHACGAMSFTVRTVAPRGTLYSYTVVHHATTAALSGAVPYVVALVSLDDAPSLRVVGNLIGVARDDIGIGMALEAFWEDHRVDDGTVIRLPQWRCLM